MKNIKSLTILFLTLLVSACTGHSSATFSSSENSSSPVDERDYYDGYYSALVSWNNGEDLKNQLNAIIRNGYQPLSYVKSNKQNYDTNISADHTKDDFEYLDVIYGKNNSFKTDTNKGWQREHAWCASLMCGQTTGDAVKTKGRATDFHNLFASEAGGNQSRGNKNYGNANKSAETYVDRTVDNGIDGYSYDNVTFEPANIDKGRVARAIFYMATMYKDAEDDMDGLRILEDNVKYPFESGREYAIGNLSTLLSWNNAYRVDYLEMQHNIAVYSDANNPDGIAQGNRNPYVDFPELVDYVYGSKKNDAGTLKGIIASASYLGLKDEGLSHYAIKEAKRSFSYGETLTANDYVVVGVNKDYSYQIETNNITHSFNNHTFLESEGESVTATVTTPIHTLSYLITLDPMGQCNNGPLVLTTTGINKKTPDTDQSVTYGNVPFTFNFSTSYSSVSTDGLTINNISAGGITVGSSTRALTKLTITTKESYTVDAIYIKAQAGNASSSFSLNIKVGDESIKTSTVNDNSGWKIFGSALNEPLTGKISFVFSGSNSLKINSIAFNSISS